MAKDLFTPHSDRIPNGIVIRKYGIETVTVTVTVTVTDPVARKLQEMAA